MSAAAALVAERADQTEQKTKIINVRVSMQTRELIDMAAECVGKSRSEFVLESATQHAIDVLLDRRLFVLNKDQHAALMDALQNPPPPNSELKKLMASKAPWEK